MTERKAFTDVLPLKNIIIILVCYIVGYNYLYPKLLSRLYHLFPQLPAEFYEWSFYIVYFVITIILAWPLLADSSRRFGKKFFSILLAVVLGFVLMSICAGQCSQIAEILSGSTDSQNQTEISLALESSPALICFAVLFFSPLVEEITFRGCLFRPLQSRGRFNLGLILSALLFGFLHVYEAMFAGNLSDGWFALTYGCMGLFLGGVYYITDNFWAPVLLHLLNNAVSLYFMLR